MTLHGAKNNFSSEKSSSKLSSPISVYVRANRIKSYVGRGGRRFASPFALQSRIRIEDTSLIIPLARLRPSCDFLRARVSEVNSDSRSWSRSGETRSWRTCRATEQKTRAWVSFAAKSSHSLSLFLPEMWLQKFKLPSHKEGIKSLREGRSFAEQKALTGEAFLSSFSLRILARPLTEFDHLSARCDSQKK